jgi:HEAT repeat protein
MKTYAQLKALLDVDEPDYPALANEGPAAIPHLRRMAASGDPALASKAVSLAGMIGGDAGVAVIVDAAGSPDPIVRVAAAHAAGLLPRSAGAARVVGRLLGDKDIGVVKVAARAAADRGDPADAATLRKATARIATAERDAARAPKPTGGTPVTDAGRAAPKPRRAPVAEMPAGRMSEPPKGAKARAMPAGKMD